MTSLFLVALLAGADPAPAATRVQTAQALRRDVSQALRQEATAAGDAHRAAVRGLVAVAERLKNDTLLVEDDRKQLAGVVRNRLAKASQRIEKQGAAAVAAQAAPPRARRPANVKNASPPLAQQINPGAPAPGGASGSNDYGDELVELIQTTIAPSSWDVNGGPGAIVFFRPLNVLVITNTGAAHSGVGDLVQQLQAAGP